MCKKLDCWPSWISWVGSFWTSWLSPENRHVSLLKGQDFGSFYGQEATQLLVTHEKFTNNPFSLGNLQNFKIISNQPFSEDIFLGPPQWSGAPFSKFFQFCQLMNSRLKLAPTGISVAWPAPKKPYESKSITIDWELASLKGWCNNEYYIWSQSKLKQ